MTSSDFSLPLLAWYKSHKRDLPWRRLASDPYAVWISEIMLQQTTVAAVIPFYERWMARFPDVATLAAAPIDDVLKQWAGLGYYARARNLHKAACRMSDMHGGKVPATAQELLALPGIGRYTAGAILSIAFGQREAVLDANVVRVLSRLYAVEDDPKKSSTQSALWKLAQTSIPERNVGDFNQALMELGALVCTPADPRCGSCPIREDCAAAEAGDPAAYPRFTDKKRWLDVEDIAVAISDERGRLALLQRPLTDMLWGGLWELPRATRHADESQAECAARAAARAVASCELESTPFATHKHVVANRRITLRGYRARLLTSRPPVEGPIAQIVWEDVSQIGKYALASPQVRLVELLVKYEAQPTLELP